MMRVLAVLVRLLARWNAGGRRRDPCPLFSVLVELSGPQGPYEVGTK
jgi:hypothetical protein